MSTPGQNTNSILPRLLTEAQAANELGVSVSTLMRTRQLGNITHTRVGHLIRYTEAHLADYIERNTQPCRNNRNSERLNSVGTGSVNAPIPANGAGRGSMPKPDRHAAQASLLTTLKRPSSPSRNG